MLNNIQDGLDNGLKKIAEISLLKKLEQKGVNKNDLKSEDSENLLKSEMEIIKNDGKKVGAGIGIGLAISVVTGGLI